MIRPIIDLHIGLMVFETNYFCLKSSIEHLESIFKVLKKKKNFLIFGNLSCKKIFSIVYLNCSSKKNGKGEKNDSFRNVRWLWANDYSKHGASVPC